MITFAESHVNCCSSFKTSQIEVFIVNLNVAINEGNDIKALGLQADFESNFLPMGIAYSALTENTDHLFKHLNDSTGGNDGSNVKTYQQILRHSIATLTFTFRIDFIRRNLSKAN